MHIANHVACDVCGGECGVRALQVAVHAHFHVREVAVRRRDEQLYAFVLVARKSDGKSVLRHGQGGELSARHDLLHRRGLAEEQGGRGEPVRLACRAEAHVVAGMGVEVAGGGCRGGQAGARSEEQSEHQCRFHHAANIP